MLEMEQTLNGFINKELRTGEIIDETDGMYPTKLLGYEGDGEFLAGSDTSTIYGYVIDGEVEICNNENHFTVREGFYFSTVGELKIQGTGKVALIERYGYRGMFQIGGPVEHRGRLAYIDGCSDSLLIHPARKGDPCLNLLVFPPNIRQTMHIHPSIRMGIVASGKGRCITPQGEKPLVPGTVFCLQEMAQHCFYTDESGMKIVAYHPDSDSGPSDEDHPMFNRTLTNR
ncbi:hypothetical protein ACTHPB_27590 [Priestia megaterium]|uniref:hypothetical protein n=1 Tax=Priestia megaterium TaxID=1404 RepID=UPI003F80D94C